MIENFFNLEKIRQKLKIVHSSCLAVQSLLMEWILKIDLHWCYMKFESFGSVSPWKLFISPVFSLLIMNHWKLWKTFKTTWSWDGMTGQKFYKERKSTEIAAQPKTLSTKFKSVAPIRLCGISVVQNIPQRFLMRI